jgi:hypothetical protein
MSPSGDTIGQTVLAQRDFLTESLGDTAAMATAYLPGLIANSRFRTNLGFVAGAGTGAPLVIDYVITGADGSSLGSERFAIPAGSFMHLQFSSRRIAAGNFDEGAARVIIVSGDGAVVPYASVIDNTTADAVFVSGNFPANSPFAKVAPSVFEELFNRFSSNR